MLFAQFYNRSAVDGITLVAACGDRAAIILDARYKPTTNGEIAANEAKKRGYVAWAIFSGDSFTRCRRISGPYAVSGREDSTACSAAYGA